jgi:hypothetical protein
MTDEVRSQKLEARSQKFRTRTAFWFLAFGFWLLTSPTAFHSLSSEDSTLATTT